MPIVQSTCQFYSVLVVFVTLMRLELDATFVKSNGIVLFINVLLFVLHALCAKSVSRSTCIK